MQTKSDFIASRSDASVGLAQVGGKGLSLAKMARAGFPVPHGFHITTEAYRTFVAVNDLQTKILAALADVDSSRPASLEAASAAICGSFADARIPSEIAGSILAAYESLGPRTLDDG